MLASSSPMTSLPDGRAIPAIGFGTYLIPAVETRDAVYEALKVGYRLIDTAACYFNEEQTAEAIHDFLEDNPSVKRKDIIYTSKIWQDDFEEPEVGIEESVEQAKAIGQIDLYLVHSPEGGRDGRRHVWKALEDAVEAGTIAAIGVSNWSEKHLAELLSWKDLRIKPAVNQIEINPWFQQTAIVDFCQANGIAVEAYSPLALGYRMDDPKVQAVAKRHKVTPAQVLLAFAIARNTIPIPKSLKPARILENYVSTDLTLTAEELEEIGDKNERYVTVPGWDPVQWD